MSIAALLLATVSGAALQTAPMATPAIQTAPLTQSQAQPAASDPQDPEDEDLPTGVASSDAYDLGEIVVSSAKPRGSVDGDIAPDIVLDAEQLRAYGASNIAELLTALEPLTRSSRGRSGGGPVVLLNGRRTSGFQEIRNIPFEAIERTEILPEEVALTYGYSADQRVVNIVLRQAFRSITSQASLRAPTQGGRTSTELETGLFSIQEGNRWSLDIEYTHDTALFESERDIDRTGQGSPFDLIGNIGGLNGGEIDPALSALVGSPVTVAGVPVGTATPGLGDFVSTAGAARTGDLTAYRTLQPRGDDVELSGSLARDLNSTTKATVSLSLQDTASFSYLGLPGVTLTLPEDSAFSPFGQDVLLYRFIDAPGALTRDNESRNATAGLLLDGFVGDWRWTLSGAYDWTQTDTSTGRGLDATAYQARLLANDQTANPFGVLGVDQFTTLTDTARSTSSGGNLEGVLTGNLWEGPAGNLRSTFKFGVDTRSLESESVRSGVFDERSLSRDRVYGTTNFSLPIADRSRDVLQPLGDLSINFNAGYDQISDFGGLTTLGMGANWSPIEPLSFIVSYTDEQGAPSVQQLNDPTISTPNTPVFDYATGQTVNIIRISGGNPDLESDNRQVLKLGVNFQPFSERDLRFSSNYTWSRTNDEIASFPTITADLEAALPGRFVRDAAGNLLSIDARPLNYERTERQDLRTGFNFSTPFGKPDPAAAQRGGRGQGQGGPGGARIPGGPPPGGGAGGPPPGGGGFRMGGPGGGGRGGNMQPGQGRFNLSIYHTFRFQEEIVIREGLPVLDLLDGSATGSSGGQPRNEVQVQAGVFKNGFGAFLNANWRQGTRVDGALGGSDLEFSDLTKVNLNVFADLGARRGLVEKYGWLKGSRISLGVDNIFDERLDVRSSTGETPLNYQPDFLDPLGRTIRINFRKIIF